LGQVDLARDFHLVFLVQVHFLGVIIRVLWTVVMEEVISKTIDYNNNNF